MIPLHIGYSICGFVTGLVLLFTFLTTLPDGKLHIIFCDVGQGDAVYVRFPDGRDALIDGGPNNKVISCLSRHMAFWDRSIDIVFLTHPEQDHVAGLVPVLERYAVGHVVEADVPVASDGYRKFAELLAARGVLDKRVAAGERISAAAVTMDIVWPSAMQVARMKSYGALGGSSVLGTQAGDPNDSSLVIWLRYGEFDVWLPGDAGIDTEAQYHEVLLADDSIDVLKVPHHGSRTGMNDRLIDLLRPKLAVISVGKNTYGHPSADVLQLLAKSHVQLLRTDTHGDVEVVSDGIHWRVL